MEKSIYYSLAHSITSTYSKNLKTISKYKLELLNPFNNQPGVLEHYKFKIRVMESENKIITKTLKTHSLIND
jgi:hypothetical protein